MPQLTNNHSRETVFTLGTSGEREREKAAGGKDFYYWSRAKLHDNVTAMDWIMQCIGKLRLSCPPHHFKGPIRSTCVPSEQEFPQIRKPRYGVAGACQERRHDGSLGTHGLAPKYSSHRMSTGVANVWLRRLVVVMSSCHLWKSDICFATIMTTI